MKKNVIISLISIVALNAVCLSTVTIAWFTAKNTVDNSVDGVVAVDGSIVSKVEVFNTASGVEYESGYRYFEKTASDTLNLAEYTLLDKRYQSLIKVTLTGTYSKIQISAKTNSNSKDKVYYIGDLNNDTELTQLKTEGNPLSNITDFYLLENTGDLAEATAKDTETGNDISCYKLKFTEDTTHNTFVTSKDNTCTGIAKDDDGYGYVNLGTLSDVNYFYIVMGYNVNSIAQIYSKYLGSSITSGGGGTTSIKFSMDYYFHIDDLSGSSGDTSA